MKPVRPTIRSAKGEAPATAPVVSPGHAVDVPYTLWLATVAGALMATVALAIVVAIYLLDATLSLTGGAPAFSSDMYFRLFELAALFAAVAVVTHFLRLRLEAIRQASILVPLPNRVVVCPPTGAQIGRAHV